MDNMNDIKERWTREAESVLLNKTIVKVRYLTDKEVDDLAWSSSAIVLELNDGTLIFPSQDDEGNDAGAIFTTNEKLQIIPVI